MKEFSYLVVFPGYESWRDGMWPEGLKDWLKENKIQYSFSVMNGRISGIYLTEFDAVAYRLAFE